MRSVAIGDYVIGEGQPTYIIAELSGNHGGRIERALEMLRAAHQAGANAVKLQVYRPDTITLDTDKSDFAIPEANAWGAYKTLYNLYEYAHTPWEWLPELFKEAKRLNVELFGSVFDSTAVDELEQYDVKAYKIASPEIVDMALLEKVARTGKPVVLSTGLANLSDIHAALEQLSVHGCTEIVLLKCTTAYPTPPEEVNLITLSNMKAVFRCPVGLSDHTVGIGVSVAAVALGAAVIEKHLKLDDAEETVDSFFSLTMPVFKNMIEEIRRAERAVGEVSYDLTPAALENRHGKRSLYVSATIKQGEVFSEANIKSVRPGYGLAPKYLSVVIGKRAACDLQVGDRLSWGVIVG